MTKHIYIHTSYIARGGVDGVRFSDQTTASCSRVARCPYKPHDIGGHTPACTNNAHKRGGIPWTKNRYEMNQGHTNINMTYVTTNALTIQYDNDNQAAHDIC